MTPLQLGPAPQRVQLLGTLIQTERLVHHCRATVVCSPFEVQRNLAQLHEESLEFIHVQREFFCDLSASWKLWNVSDIMGTDHWTSNSSFVLLAVTKVETICCRSQREIHTLHLKVGS